MNKRQQIIKTKRWVVKIGSALLTNNGLGLNHQGIAGWVKQIVTLNQSGVEVLLVSSGSVAEGMYRLAMTKRPDSLHELQAAAAVGQMGLVQAYESKFQTDGLHTAQVLLTHDDLSDRKRYLNARSTLRTLLDYNVIPIINENDTVITDEIRFGDNDTLAALVANLVEADLLVILTDQSGLFDADPRTKPDANLVQQSDVDNQHLDTMVQGKSGSLGRGGMFTKLRAARLASRSATSTVIATGQTENILLQIHRGENCGTFLTTTKEPLNARKQWLAGHLQTKGSLTLDEGAIKVLKHSGRSLLPVGVKKVTGNFRRGEVVSCINLSGQEVARGLINYNIDETKKIMSHPSEEIEAILGYIDEPELIHRDNLVMLLS